jgi:hypothetical protein
MRGDCNLCRNPFRQPRLNTAQPRYPTLSGASLGKMGNGYLWKDTDSQLNHVANVRAAHGEELTDLPGVVGIGIGKDHIILYVSDESIEVPNRIEDVAIVKICRYSKTPA